MLYKCVLTLDGITQPVEIMDTSASCEESSDEHLQWADAFVVVYSITDKDSYQWAASTVQVINVLPSLHFQLRVFCNDKVEYLLCSDTFDLNVWD